MQLSQLGTSPCYTRTGIHRDLQPVRYEQHITTDEPYIDNPLHAFVAAVSHLPETQI